MILHKCEYESSLLYTLLDSNERVAVYPTAFFRALRKGRWKRRWPQTSQRTIAYAVKNHCDWLEQESPVSVGLTVDEALEEVESNDIHDWIEYQRDSGVTESTIANREALVCEMYKWLTAKGVGVRSGIPWEDGLYTRAPKKRAPRFLTTEQVIRLLRGMHNESQRVATHLMYDTGVRASELIRLTNQYLPNESDWPEEVNYYPMLIPGSKSRTEKFKFRYTVISRPMLARVRRYQASIEYKLNKNWRMYDRDKPVFLNIHGEKLTYESVYNCIADAWERQQGQSGEVSPHKLRHGTAYSVLRSELGKKVHDKMLLLKTTFGHAHIDTTEIYTAIPVAALEAMSGAQEVRIKYLEADEIYQATYLPGHKHVEKRGRRK